ncbi:MAG: YggT family protein [Alphaproteobacteria bacterium]|nr:YggT family protein [Alphaproteobacteria bacterium]
MGLIWAIYVYFLSPLLTALFIVFFVWVIAGWLAAFNVINTRNSNVRAILGFLAAVCEPLCRPIRKIIPPINGVLDLSPLIVVLIIVFVRDWLLPTLIGMIAGPVAYR